MADPISVGALAAAVFALAAEAALKGSVGEATKDCYAALKEKVKHWGAPDVDALEKAPSSPARQAVLAELINGLPSDEQAAVLGLTGKLLGMVGNGSAGSVGVDIGRVEALNAAFHKIVATTGTAVRIQELSVKGNLDVSHIRTGAPPGKR